MVDYSIYLSPPGNYIPRKEVVVEETVRATVIKPNQAIRLRARKECMDREGTDRVMGEEWLVKKTGAYLPGAYEWVVDIVNAYVLTEKKALHMRAMRTFKDDFGFTRKNGEEWLITWSEAETHIPNVYEKVGPSLVSKTYTEYIGLWLHTLIVNDSNLIIGSNCLWLNFEVC